MAGLALGVALGVALLLGLAHPVSAQQGFTAPALLNSNGISDAGYDSDVKIVTDGVRWIAAWYSDEDLNGTAGTDDDVFFATSLDNGSSWTAPALLNSNGTSDAGHDSDPNLATDGAGNWVAVWTSSEDLDGTAGTDPDIFVATSANNGASWTTPALLNSNGTTDAGADVEPRIATDAGGNWVAIWGSTEDLNGTAGTDFDLFVATSADNGSSWTSPALLNSNGTSDAGGDTFPQLITDAAGNWIASWQSNEDLNGTAGTDDDVFFATSANNGASWTAPALLNSNGASDTGGDFAQTISTDAAGNWVASWTSAENLDGTAGIDYDIFFAVSVNDGASWTAPALLNTNGTTDAGADVGPQISTDAAGHWIAAWRSGEDLNGTAGTDEDIFVATSANNGASWSAPALLNVNGTSDTGNDLLVRLATDTAGHWVAVWQSWENLNGTAGTDDDIFFATSNDIDGDEIPDLSDAFPLDPLESTDTDGDGTGNNADLDDDGDGLPDAVETHTGTYIDSSNTGTDPLNPDSDFDGVPDGNDLAPLSGGDCRARNPNLVLVWGNDAPFGVDHEHSPELGDRYLMNAGNTLPGLAADDSRIPTLLAEDLRSGVQNLFTQARDNLLSLPATSNGLNVTNHLTGPPPAVGTPGSPSLLYIVDRSVLETNDPDFGALGGFAWTGVNRFSRSCTGGLGSVIIDPGAVPPATDPGYAAALDQLVEEVAHEAGHLYGLRHVLRGGLAACTGDIHSGDPAVMDYIDDGANTVLAQCAGPGCPVTEPPDCSGQETGEHHNPLYHYLRYVVGDSTADLAIAGVTPGSWDQESVPILTWEVQFNFTCTLCNQYPLYNVRIIEVLPGGEVGEVVWPLGEAFESGAPNAYPDLTIEELNQLVITLPQTSGFKLEASRTDPATNPSEPVPVDIVIPPVYPQSDAAVTVEAVLLQVDEVELGIYETTTLATDPAVSSLLRYESRSDGLYVLSSDPSEPAQQLTTWPFIPPVSVSIGTLDTDDPPDGLANLLIENQPVPVPEPAAGAAWLAGIALLLALGRRSLTSRDPRRA